MKLLTLPRFTIALIVFVLAIITVVVLPLRSSHEPLEHRLQRNPRVPPIRIAPPADYAGLSPFANCPNFSVYGRSGFDTYGFPPNSRERCLLIEEQELFITKAQYTSRFGSMPLLLLQPRINLDEQRVIIFLVGGPRDSIFHSLESNLMYLLRHLAQVNRATVIVPAYYGTAHRSVFPAADLDFAPAEIAEWLRSFERRNPRASISIVGYSAGSLLAYDLFRMRPRLTILVSPPAVPIEDLYRRRRVSFLYGTTVERAERSGAVAFEMRGGRMVFVDLREAPMAEISRAFFGQHYHERNWVRELDGVPAERRPCLSVVFGERDDTVAQEVFFREGADRLVRTVRVPGMAHMPTDDRQAASLAARLAELAHCP